MATARNPITNDLIKSKNSNETFDKNFDQIDWSVKLDDSIKDNQELLKDLKD
jgi:hypothetical protein